MKVALYSYHAYDAVHSPGVTAGGMELQLLLLARALIARGVEVEFLVGDSAQPDLVSEGGYTFRKVFSKGSHGPLAKLRFFLGAVSASGAAVILDRGASRTSIWLYGAGRLLNKKFVFAVASDVNCDREARDPSLPHAWERRMFQMVLRRADAVVVQKLSQGQLLRTHYGRDGVLIRSLMMPAPASPVGRGGVRRDVVWIGNLHPYKQPEMFLDIARALPDVNCIMIGGARDQAYARKIADDAAAIRNLRYLGFVPQDRVWETLGTAALLVNTTVVDGKHEEGFSNTFLQAWSLGVPVVSLISDPDGMIVQQGLGRCSRTYPKLLEDIRGMLGAPALLEETGKRCVTVVQREFQGEVAVDRYIALFADLLGRGS